MKDRSIADPTRAAIAAALNTFLDGLAKESGIIPPPYHIEVTTTPEELAAGKFSATITLTVPQLR